MHLLYVTEVSIGPVELVIGVVNGNPVWPLYLGGDDGCFVGSIHPDTADEGSVSPVRPVYESNR